MNPPANAYESNRRSAAYGSLIWLVAGAAGWRLLGSDCLRIVIALFPMLVLYPILKAMGYRESVGMGIAIFLMSAGGYALGWLITR